MRRSFETRYKYMTYNAKTHILHVLLQIVAMSPSYFNLFPAIPTFAGVDNLCLTYIALPDGSYVVTMATV